MSASAELRRDLPLLFATMLVVGAGNTALQSVLPAIGRQLEVPDTLIALAFSISALLWTLAAPIWARRSDRTGRRRMVLVGLAGFSLSVLLCGFVLSAGLAGVIGGSATLLAFIAARAIYGWFGAAAPPAAQAIVATRTTRDERTKALTLLSSAFGLGTIIGPALAPFLILPVLGYAGPAYFFAGISLIVLIVVARRLPHDEPGAVGRGAATSYPGIGGQPTGASVTAAVSDPSPGALKLTDPRIWPWMFVGLVAGHVQAAAGQSVAFLVIDRLGLAPMGAQEAIGLVLIAGAGAALLVQWGLIPLLSLDPRRLVLLGLVLAVAGAGALAAADSLYHMALAFALLSGGFGFVRPGFTAGSSLAVGPAHQNAVAGRVTAVNGAVFVVGPSIGVLMYEVWRPLPYLTGAAACALLLIWCWRKLPKKGPAPKDRPESF